MIQEKGVKETFVDISGLGDNHLITEAVMEAHKQLSG